MYLILYKNRRSCDDKERCIHKKKIKKKTVCDLFISTSCLLTNGMNQIRIFTMSSQKRVRKLVVQWMEASQSFRKQSSPVRMKVRAGFCDSALQWRNKGLCWRESLCPRPSVQRRVTTGSKGQGLRASADFQQQTRHLDNSG